MFWTGIILGSYSTMAAVFTFSMAADCWFTYVADKQADRP